MDEVTNSNEKNEKRNERMSIKTNDGTNKFNIGEKMKPVKETANLREIDNLLDEDLIPNKHLIERYNNKKAEAKKLKTRLERILTDIKSLGEEMKMGSKT